MKPMFRFINYAALLMLTLGCLHAHPPVEAPGPEVGLISFYETALAAGHEMRVRVVDEEGNLRTTTTAAICVDVSPTRMREFVNRARGLFKLGTFDAEPTPISFYTFKEEYPGQRFSIVVTDAEGTRETTIDRPACVNVLRAAGVSPERHRLALVSRETGGTMGNGPASDLRSGDLQNSATPGLQGVPEVAAEFNGQFTCPTTGCTQGVCCATFRCCDSGCGEGEIRQGCGAWDHQELDPGDTHIVICGDSNDCVDGSLACGNCLP